MINLVFSSDSKGFSKSATVVASIVRRTREPVHVRYWCRGFLPENFCAGQLKLEFIPVIDDAGGKYPRHVSAAVFDRLRVIRECDDWDRCLVMDYDQVVLCDLAPLLKMDMGDALLAAKMQGEGVDMAYAMREWIKDPLPEGWEHVAEYPYFSMGPLLNLLEMRKAGTWEKLLAAHKAFGMDEQLSLTAAADGRTIGYESKWNLFPDMELQDDIVPDGVVHWTGWPKPWHPCEGVWRPDVWQAEQTNWEQLRSGQWEKPVVILIRCNDAEVVKSLVKRGWRVKLYEDKCETAEGQVYTHPDLTILSLDQLETNDIDTASMVRVYEVNSLPSATLDVLGAARDLIIVGAADLEKVSLLKNFHTLAVCHRYEWTPGGTRPSRLLLPTADERTPVPLKLKAEEDAYLALR